MDDRNFFGILQDDCRRRSLDCVVTLRQGSLFIDIRGKDKRTLDSQQVYRTESVEMAAARLHGKLKRSNAL